MIKKKKKKKKGYLNKNINHQIHKINKILNPIIFF